MKYSITHPTPKRPRQSVLNSSFNKTNENAVVEMTTEDVSHLVTEHEKQCELY